MAQALFKLHVGRDLVHGHVPRAFHHDLHARVPGARGELADLDELVDLAGVGGIGDAAGAHGVADADRHVVFVQDLEQLVVVL